MMSTQNDTVALDDIESQLKRYDDGSISVPSRKRLKTWRLIGLALELTAVLTTVFAAAMPILYSMIFGGFPTDTLILSGIVMLMLSLVFLIVGYRLSEWAAKQIYKYYVAVKQGEVLDIGHNFLNVPYIKIRGYTYAMELKIATIYPDRELWEKTFLMFKTRGSAPVEW